MKTRSEDISGYKYYTQNEISRIKRLSKKYTAEQVAERLGRTCSSVQNASHRYGIRFGATEYHKHTMKEVNAALSLRRSGKTFREVAEITGLNPNTCRSLWRRYG